MQVKVEKLRESLRALLPVIPKKSALPVLMNVLLKDGRATATDLVTAVTLELPEAEDACLIPCKPVLELLKYVPGAAILNLECRDSKLNLTWDDGKASYDTKAAEDYPALPDAPASACYLDGDLLVKALTSIAKYCATEESRPVLTGVALFLGETIEVAAGDGFRMAYQTLSATWPEESAILIPANTVKVLKHLWDKLPPAPAFTPGASLARLVVSKRQIGLARDEDRFAIRFGGVTLLGKLIDGTPPRFRELIPSDPPLKVKLMAPELDRAVRRLKDVAANGSGGVRLQWTESELVVLAKSQDAGAGKARVRAQTEGGEGHIAINILYLLSYLGGKEGLVT